MNSAWADGYLTAQKKRELIHGGIAYLEKNQKPDDGRWEHPQYSTAVTALSALSIVGAGHMPNRGHYQETLTKAIDLLLSAQRKDGLIALPGEQRSMYGHGFSTLFLSQVFGMLGGMTGGMTQNQRIKNALKSAVDLIVKSQNEKGGWYYEPFSSRDEGTITIVQIQALRSCRDAGIVVPKETIEKGLDYVKKSQYENGGIAYGVGPSGNATSALTSAGMAVLFNAGEYEVTEVHARGFQYLDDQFKEFMKGSEKKELGDHFLYTHFYAAQVYKQRGGFYREDYFRAIEQALVEQMKGGSRDIFWNIEEWPFYSTAMALLILEMELEYLPIFTD
jgi:hypothetical protein